MAEPGYSYTGQWDIAFPEGTDLQPIIDALPGSAGGDWEVTRGSLPRTSKYVDITNTTSKVGASVNADIDPATGPYVNILAMSVCAQGPAESPAK